MIPIADDPEYRALLACSAALGADPALVQAAGGNTSLKRDGVLWIKASGTWLAYARTRPIMVPVRLAPLLAALEQPGNSAEQAQDFVDPANNPHSLRPSIETTMHAVMPHKVVLHVHCVDTIAHAVREDAEQVLKPLLAGLAWAFIPYVRPGVPLARAVAAAAGADVLVLGHHGLVVGGPTTTAASALLNEASLRLRRPLRPAAPPDAKRLSVLSDGTAWSPASDPAIHTTATDPISLRLALRGSFYPDHVIFLGPGVVALQPGEAIPAALARHTAAGYPSPPVLFVPGAGVLLRKDVSPGVPALARCLADVLGRIDADAPVTTFAPADEAELMNWDAEAYRRSLDTSQ
ncbi:MAG TPA: class II aldolase/adducin family protein [Acetobacteraceae bacterium]|nr:class II aldolase/adducin family protein [Acetobacteraceae bacterium]